MKMEGCKLAAVADVIPERAESMAREYGAVPYTDWKQMLEKEEIDVRNQADQVVYQTEKALEDAKDKISADDKATVEAALNKLKDALKGTDVAAIKAATEEASKAFYPIAEKMYQQANPQGGQQPGPDMGGAQAGSASSDPNVVDADYEVVDDDNQK